MRLRVVAESDSIQTTRDLVPGGAGHTIAPYPALIDQVERSLMSGGPIRDFRIRRSLVRRNDRPVSRAVHECRTQLGEEVRQLARRLPRITVLMR